MASESAVLKAITVNEPLSITAIAKKLGSNKANQSLKNIVANLVRDGKVSENSSGRYPVYTKVGSGGSVQRQQGSTQSSVVQTPKKDLPSLPAAPESKISGYTIKPLKEKGKDKIRITLPSGKSVKIKPEQSLLVINDEPKYVVTTPQDVVTCIRNYSVDKGMRTFTVDDITQNKKIGTENDVQVPDNHIMFLSIKKHNKAAK